MPAFGLCFIAIEAVTLVTAAILYWNAFAQFIVFFLPNMVMSIVVLLVGCLFSALFIVGQKSAEHIKGRVPKRGIYATTIIAKCAFIVFMMYFLTNPILLRQSDIPGDCGTGGLQASSCDEVSEGSD